MKTVGNYRDNTRSLKEIGLRLGVSKQMAQVILRRALRKIKINLVRRGVVGARIMAELRLVLPPEEKSIYFPDEDTRPGRKGK